MPLNQELFQPLKNKVSPFLNQKLINTNIVQTLLNETYFQPSTFYGFNNQSSRANKRI